MMNEKELLDLKEQISAMERREANLRGKKNYLAKELKKKYNCKSTIEAKKRLRKLEKSFTKRKKTITAMCKDLEKALHGTEKD